MPTATRADIRTDVLTLLGTDPSISTTEANTLIQLRYASIYESHLWSRRLRDFTISVVAQVSSTAADTVTVTNGSATVTSAGTPFVSGMAGRAIQIGAEPMYCFINSVDSSSQITLGNGEGTSVTWPRATDSAASWRIFQTLYALPADAEAVLSLSADGLDLDEYDGGRARLDETDPNRQTTGDTPFVWVYAGENSTGAREIEVWPVPTVAKLLRGQYARQAPTLADETETGLPRALLVYGVASDAANMLFHKTGDQTWGDRAVFWERKYREEEERARQRDLLRLSPAMTLARRPSRVRGLRGTDFEVSHDLDALDLF